MNVVTANTFGDIRQLLLASQVRQDPKWFGGRRPRTHSASSGSESLLFQCVRAGEAYAAFIIDRQCRVGIGKLHRDSIRLQALLNGL